MCIDLAPAYVDNLNLKISRQLGFQISNANVVASHTENFGFQF